MCIGTAAAISIAAAATVGSAAVGAVQAGKNRDAAKDCEAQLLAAFRGQGVSADAAE